MATKILIYTAGDLIMSQARSGQVRGWQVQPDGSLVELDYDAMADALREGARFTPALD